MEVKMHRPLAHLRCSPPGAWTPTPARPGQEQHRFSGARTCCPVSSRTMSTLPRKFQGRKGGRSSRGTAPCSRAAYWKIGNFKTGADSYSRKRRRGRDIKK